MPTYIQLHIGLEYTDTWRRIQIEHHATFDQLHEAIQDAMLWEYAHLWHFASIDNPWTPFAGVMDAPPATEIRLPAHLAEKGAQCIYLYDFGDSWTHIIEVEDVIESNAQFHRKLIDGQFSAPPEDCGGPGGYDRFRELIVTGKDPWGEDEQELLQWLDGWTPDGFELQTEQADFDS